jgi:hypothetical protein
VVRGCRQLFRRFLRPFHPGVAGAEKPVVYVSFDRSPNNVVSFLGPLAESQIITILDCFTNGNGDRFEVFSKFYEKDGAQWPYQVIRINDPANSGQVGEAIYGLHGQPFRRYPLYHRQPYRHIGPVGR